MSIALKQIAPTTAITSIPIRTEMSSISYSASVGRIASAVSMSASSRGLRSRRTLTGTTVYSIGRSPIKGSRWILGLRQRGTLRRAVRRGCVLQLPAPWQPRPEKTHRRRYRAAARGIYLAREGGGIAGEVLQTKSRRHFRAAVELRNHIRKIVAELPGQN